MDKRGLRIAFFGDSLTEGIVGASYFEILQQELPQHDLFNCGRGGDTVISLYRRLQQMDMGYPLDLGFLWIGVNDVFVRSSWTYPVIKRLRRQPWSKDRKEFREYYRKLVVLLHHNITHVYTVPPLLIGEDCDNPWNRELEIQSRIIQEVSHSLSGVEFVDLRETIISQLPTQTIGLYVPKSFFRIILDALFVKTPEVMEKKAAERGLSLTLDGVHLNSTGAGMVAEVFMSKIEEFLRRNPAT